MDKKQKISNNNNENRHDERNDVKGDIYSRLISSRNAKTAIFPPIDTMSNSSNVHDNKGEISRDDYYPQWYLDIFNLKKESDDNSFMIKIKPLE